jgi:hypothetical protein
LRPKNKVIEVQNPHVTKHEQKKSKIKRNSKDTRIQNIEGKNY